jgi:lysylphosphatidylglycerol synthase-like protein
MSRSFGWRTGFAIFGYWPLLLLAGVLLYRYRPRHYYLLRDVGLISGAIGLVIFAHHRRSRAGGSRALRHGRRRMISLFGAMVQRFGQVDVGLAALALCFHLANHVLRSVAWRNVLAAAYPDRRVRLLDVGAAYAIGVALNAVLPGRGGDGAKVLLARTRVPGSTVPTIAATMSVIVLFDMVAATLLVLGRCRAWTASPQSWITLVGRGALCRSSPAAGPRASEQTAGRDASELLIASSPGARAAQAAWRSRGRCSSKIIPASMERRTRQVSAARMSRRTCSGLRPSGRLIVTSQRRGVDPLS